MFKPIHRIGLKPYFSSIVGNSTLLLGKYIKCSNESLNPTCKHPPFLHNTINPSLSPSFLFLAGVPIGKTKYLNNCLTWLFLYSQFQSDEYCIGTLCELLTLQRSPSTICLRLCPMLLLAETHMPPFWNVLVFLYLCLQTDGRKHI